jgi:hypothetical protein
LHVVLTHRRSFTSSWRRLTDTLAMYSALKLGFIYFVTFRRCASSISFSTFTRHTIFWTRCCFAVNSKRQAKRLSCGSSPRRFDAGKYELHSSPSNLVTLPVARLSNHSIGFFKFFYLRTRYVNLPNRAGSRVRFFCLLTSIYNSVFSDVAGKVSEKFDAVLRALK